MNKQNHTFSSIMISYVLIETFTFQTQTWELFTLWLETRGLQ